MRASEFENQASAKQILKYINSIHHEGLTDHMTQVVLKYPQWQLMTVNLSDLHIPDQDLDDPDQEPEQDPYNRVMMVDPAHANDYSSHFVDSRPIVIDDRGFIIDGNHRAWAAAELLNRDTIPAWRPVKPLTELGNAPAEYKPNRKRSRSLFHSTVDGHWVDVFFDRSEFNGTLHITFTVDGNYDTPTMPTKASKSTVKILSTVLNIVKRQLPEYMARARPPALSFTAKEDNRAGLYRKYFVPVIQNILGPKWQLEEYPNMGMTVFNWRPAKKQDVAESESTKAGIVQTEVYGTRAYHAKCMQPGCDWQSKRYDRIRQAQVAAQKHAEKHVGRKDVTEAFDQPYKLKWEKGEFGDHDALATLDDGTYLSIMFNRADQSENNWGVEFYRNNSQAVTGEGDAQRVFATVLTAISQFIKKKKPHSLFFSAVKEDDPTGSRTKLYDRLVQRYASQLGYNLQKTDYPMQIGYELTRQDNKVKENFADGKVKGKSRPGRVKRAGASCEGSVSDLRAKARKYGGERGKMYHWCANMKGGRK